MMMLERKVLKILKLSLDVRFWLKRNSRNGRNKNSSVLLI